MDCCVFIHYGVHKKLNPVDQFYIEEVVKIVDEVLLVTNERELDTSVLPSQVKLLKVKNEGYDFGMFVKALSNLELSKLDRLLLINDSNFLVGDLHQVVEKGKRLHASFWGIIDSNEKPWFSTHQNNFHLQSHFLVWEKSGIQTLVDFLAQAPIQDILNERDAKKLRRKVINHWEIGVSQYFLSKGFTPKAVYESKKLAEELNLEDRINLTFKQPDKLLSIGYPLLKKRYVKRNTWLSRVCFPHRKWEHILFSHISDKYRAINWIKEIEVLY